jgi:hypothetical protein
MKRPEAAALQKEEASWSRRSALSRWLTRFGLLRQWGLAALAWSMLAVVAYATDLAVQTRELSIVETVLFGLSLVPGAVMVTAIAVRNTWIRLRHPERFERNRARARYPEFRHPAEVSPELRAKMRADWDIRGTIEY